MPGAEPFLDSNILLYAVSTSPNERAKTEIARKMIESEPWCWSAQVAAEFVHVSTSPKRKLRLSLDETEKWISTWRPFRMASIDRRTVRQALEVARRYQVSYFDAQIIAAAKRLRCKIIYSEDLNHGQDYGGVRILNPFRG